MQGRVSRQVQVQEGKDGRHGNTLVTSCKGCTSCLQTARRYCNASHKTTQDAVDQPLCLSCPQQQCLPDAEQYAGKPSGSCNFPDTCMLSWNGLNGHRQRPVHRHHNHHSTRVVEQSKWRDQASICGHLWLLNRRRVPASRKLQKQNRSTPWDRSETSAGASFSRRVLALCYHLLGEPSAAHQWCACVCSGGAASRSGAEPCRRILQRLEASSVGITIIWSIGLESTAR